MTPLFHTRLLVRLVAHAQSLTFATIFLCASPMLLAGCSCDARGGNPFAMIQPVPEAGLDAIAETGPMDPCPPGQVLRFDVCVRTPASCAAGEECQNDSCCIEGECIPYGVGPCGDANTECDAPPPVGEFAPVIECEWTTPTDTSNGSANHRDVMTTPVVVDFNFDDDPTTRHPSIVFATVLSGSSIRVIDGATCTEQYAVTGRGAIQQLALGDLDGDGRPEIVANARTSTDVMGTVAFRFDPATDAFVEMWSGHDAAGTHISARTPAIHDLNNDGVPEVIAGGHVFDSTGLLIVRAFREYPPDPVLADVDGDGIVELVHPEGVSEANFETARWETEPYFDARNLAGARIAHAAVADFGDYGDGPGVAELAVVGGGTIAVLRITGEPIFGPFDISDDSRGGPPTVADFDGDGEPEIGVADGSVFSVWDLECDAEPLPAGCARRGQRWSQPAQDASSGQTGSAVFDFEGDGAAEAVYADECFLRIYDGSTGEVTFSAPRTSNTLWEYPVIADVDGDFNSEIVVGSNTVAFSRNCPDAHDPLFTGPACDMASPCASPLHECVEGFCRAPRRPMRGVQVYGDLSDRWVNSRPVWNQYGYHVTHVNDDGTIPSTDDWQTNWMEPGLNNYRQNVQGIAGRVPAPDLTIRPNSGWVCSGSPSQVFEVSVCNRGTEPVAPGVAVTFYVDEVSICSGSRTASILSPGMCEDVSCSWDAAPSEPVNVIVVADDDEAGLTTYTECREENNTAIFSEDSCNLI